MVRLSGIGVIPSVRQINGRWPLSNTHSVLPVLALTFWAWFQEGLTICHFLYTEFVLWPTVSISLRNWSHHLGTLSSFHLPNQCDCLCLHPLLSPQLVPTQRVPMYSSSTTLSVTKSLFCIFNHSISTKTCSRLEDWCCHDMDTGCSRGPGAFSPLTQRNNTSVSVESSVTSRFYHIPILPLIKHFKILPIQSLHPSFLMGSDMQNV